MKVYKPWLLKKQRISVFHTDLPCFYAIAILNFSVKNIYSNSTQKASHGAKICFSKAS